jgi:hypothetical protein
VSGLVPRWAVGGNKVLHDARTAEDYSGQARPPTARVVYVVSTSRTTKTT